MPLSSAQSGSLCLAILLYQALSGSIRLSLALYCLQIPCLAHKALAWLEASLLSYSTLSSPVPDPPPSVQTRTRRGGGFPLSPLQPKKFADGRTPNVMAGKPPSPLWTNSDTRFCWRRGATICRQKQTRKRFLGRIFLAQWKLKLTQEIQVSLRS